MIYLGLPVHPVTSMRMRLLICMQHVITATDDVRNSLAQADQEARLKHLEELGYPDGYDPTNPVANGEFTEEDWNAIQQEEAMRSLAEDAMNDYYQEKQDISDHVLKP